MENIVDNGNDMTNMIKGSGEVREMKILTKKG